MVRLVSTIRLEGDFYSNPLSGVVPMLWQESSKLAVYSCSDYNIVIVRPT